MKNSISRFVFFLAGILTAFSCNNMSTINRLESVGMNGGFEYFEDGQPANWHFFGIEDLRNKTYELIADSNSYKEGKQSLKILVHSMNKEANYTWQKPGFFQTYKAKAGESYTLDLWVKNIDCDFVINIESEKERGRHTENVVTSSDELVDWTNFTYEYVVPEEFESIRFQVQILSEGSFWIDGITIKDASGRQDMYEWAN